MRATRLVFVLSIAVAGWIAAGAAQQAAQNQPRSLALVGGMLIDGAGGAPIRNSVVLIRGERIEKVGTVGALAVPSGYEQISTEGMTVMPGLWDLHVHLVYNGHPNTNYWFKYVPQFERVTIPASAEQMLMAGVTSTRDMAAPAQAILAVKKRIASGEIPGPTLYVAGHALSGNRTGTLTANFMAIRDVNDARAKTRQLIEGGVDLIKMFNPEMMSPEERAAIVTEAHGRGLKVAAHGVTDMDIRLGLEYGVDDFQHFSGATPEFPPDIVAAIRERVRRGPPLYWTPTLGPDDAYVATRPEYMDNPAGYRGLPQALADDVRKGWAEYQPNPQQQPENWANIKRRLAQLQELGVVLLFGSNEGTVGALASQSAWMEADILVREIGMDPMTVIRKMTSDAARFMGVDRDTGTVNDGKYADVIVVRGDPLRHIDVLSEPKVVIKHGRRYK